MSKMGVENRIFVRLLIQRTSTKNFYFIPSPQSAVRVLYLVRVSYPAVHIFQSAFYTWSICYTQSAVRSPCFILTVHLKVYQNVIAKHCASQGLIPQDLLSHIHVPKVSFLHSFYCCCFISAYSFHNYLSLCGSWQKK